MSKIPYVFISHMISIKASTLCFFMGGKEEEMKCDVGKVDKKWLVDCSLRKKREWKWKENIMDKIFGGPTYSYCF